MIHRVKEYHRAHYYYYPDPVLLAYMQTYSVQVEAVRTKARWAREDGIESKTNLAVDSLVPVPPPPRQRTKLLPKLSLQWLMMKSFEYMQSLFSPAHTIATDPLVSCAVDRAAISGARW